MKNRKLPCICTCAEGCYDIGCVVHDEEAFRRKVLMLAETMKTLGEDMKMLTETTKIFQKELVRLKSETQKPKRKGWLTRTRHPFGLAPRRKR